jgi:hypothetical protein
MISSINKNDMFYIEIGQHANSNEPRVKTCGTAVVVLQDNQDNKVMSFLDLISERQRTMKIKQFLSLEDKKIKFINDIDEKVCLTLITEEVLQAKVLPLLNNHK